MILDDCWSVGRNASDNNSLVADPIKFPRGMAAVGDGLHALGLGFGVFLSFSLALSATSNHILFACAASANGS